MEYHKLTAEDIENLRPMIADPEHFITEVTGHWDHDQFKTVRAMPDLDLVIQPTTADGRQAIYLHASTSHALGYCAGNISTNAGGLKAIKYGVTREHIREVKVALTDGKVYKFGSKSVK
ncbi:FAD-binding protein [Lactobacillus delbrueckii subsp. bulgaricus]